MSMAGGGVKAMEKIDPYLPFSFCEKCRFFDLREEPEKDDCGNTVVIAQDCYNAEVCINAIKLAKREEEER